MNSPAPRPEILVVEDNEVNQLVAEEVFEELGHAVEIAASGAEALTRVREREFRFVLMDCRMPQMDGVETTRRIRELEKELSRTPCAIVALTGNVTTGERERCEGAGMNGYLTKPLVIGDLEAELAKYFVS